VAGLRVAAAGATAGVSEGKTSKEALRALKRQLSDAIYARLVADAARRQTMIKLNHSSTTNSRKRPDPAGHRRTRTRSTP